MEDPVVSLERNLYGHPLAGLLWERQIEKVLWEHGWKKCRIGNACSLNEKKEYSYLCMWTISNWLERKRKSIRLGKYSWKTLIWENQHHSLIMLILGCTQRECQMSKDFVDDYRSMFESRISSGAMEELSETKAAEKPDAETISSWSCDMGIHAKKCVEIYFELANKNNSTVTQSCNSMHDLLEN